MTKNNFSKIIILAGVFAVVLLGLSACKEPDAEKTLTRSITVDRHDSVVEDDDTKPIIVGGTTLASATDTTVSVTFVGAQIAKGRRIGYSYYIGETQYPAEENTGIAITIATTTINLGAGGTVTASPTPPPGNN